MTRATITTKLDTDNPWPGLESYCEDAQGFFYGRGHECEKLLKKVLDAPVTVLFGRSGLGKTSLLHAGLFPLLRNENFLPIYVRFDLKPGAASLSSQLHDAVRNAIAAEAPDALLPQDDESLWEYLHRADLELWNARNYLLTPVIVLDQFEELFTLGAGVPDQVEAFKYDLADLAENRIPAELAVRIKNDPAEARRFNLRAHNCKLLISLREDFLAHLEDWCRFIPALGRARMRLLPLATDEAFDAVYKPAEHLMTPELAHQVVGIIAGAGLHTGADSLPRDGEVQASRRGAGEVEPTLLSLVCRELNEERKRLGKATFDEQLVDEHGRSTIPNYYISCVSGMRAEVAEFIENQLITTTGFRDFEAVEDAVPSRLNREELDQLISSRLVRLAEYHGTQRIELIHDVLTGTVREHRDRRKAEDAKAELAARAEAEKHAFEQAAARHRAELDRERRARRRFKKLSIALAAVCAATVVLALVAWTLRGSAIDARDTALAERLSSRGQLMLLTAQPGSELEAFNKLLAAQKILDKDGAGGLLTALITRPALQKVIGLPEEGSLLSADGQRVVTSDEAGVQMLDGRTGQPVGKPFADSASGLLAVSWDGRFVALDDVGGARVWDARDGTPVGPPLVGSGSALWVALNPDGHRVAAVVTTEDNKFDVRLWNARTGEQMFSGGLAAESDFVSALAFDHGGTSLATGSWNGAVTLWDATTGARLRDMDSARSDSAVPRESDGSQTEHTAVNSLAFSPDGQTIAAGTREGGAWRLRTWNAQTGASLANSDVTGPGDVSVAFSPDGTRVVAGSTDGNVGVSDAATGRTIGGTLFFVEPVTQVALQGDQIVTVTDRSLGISDARTNATLATELRGSKAAGLAGSDAQYGLYVSTAGPRIAVLRGNDLRWLDPDTGALLSAPIASEAIRDVVQLDISDDRKWLALAGFDADIDIIDASSGQERGHPMRGHTAAVTDIAFSPDGKTLASVSDDKTVRLWNWTTGSSIADPGRGHQWAPENVVFSEDGQRVYTRSPDSIRIWDSELEPIGTPIIGSNITAFALSHDGGRIAAVDSRSNDIQEYDAKTGEKIGNPLEGHSKWVSDLTYSSDGQFLASIGKDAKLRFWDVRSGTQIGMPVPIEAVGDSAYVTLSDDDRRVFVTATRDPSAQGGGIWEIPGPAAWADMLCSKLAATPTEEQWKDLIDPEADFTELCRG
ncbi:nSTAND1 domain-containing NTPase [Mycobacterium syngnathidarum]